MILKVLAAVAGIAVFTAAFAFWKQDQKDFPYDPKKPKFPPVRGSNLEEKAYQLPKDFEKPYNLVVLAYQIQQQRDVDSWLPNPKKMTAGRDDIRIYELPVLGNYAVPQQKYIDAGMKRGIPDKAIRDVTITLYVDRPSFLKALHLEKMDKIHLLMVDRDGEILWQGEDRYSEKVAASLESFLKGLKPAKG